MGLRDTRRIELRRAVLDAAMDIIITDGMALLTVADVAKRIGVSVGGIYRHFESKGEILVALQEQAIGAFAAYQTARLARLERTLDGARTRAATLARVAAALAAYLEHAVDERAYHRLLDEALSVWSPLLTDDLARRVDAALGPVIGRVVSLLEAAVAARALDAGDAVTRTHILWATLHGVDHFRKRDRIQPETLRAGPLAVEAVDALLAGWGATRRELAAARRLIPAHVPRKRQRRTR
jgi:AcrR family transcriptional regulator